MELHDARGNGRRHQALDGSPKGRLWSRRSFRVKRRFQRSVSSCALGETCSPFWGGTRNDRAHPPGSSSRRLRGINQPPVPLVRGIAQDGLLPIKEKRAARTGGSPESDQGVILLRRALILRLLKKLPTVFLQARTGLSPQHRHLHDHPGSIRSDADRNRTSNPDSIAE
jgi:hypothetical protein